MAAMGRRQWIWGRCLHRCASQEAFFCTLGFLCTVCGYISYVIYKIGQKCSRSVVIYTQSFLQCSLGFSNCSYLLLRIVVSFVFNCQLQISLCWILAHMCVCFLCSCGVGIGDVDRTGLAAKLASQPCYLSLYLSWCIFFFSTGYSNHRSIFSPHLTGPTHDVAHGMSPSGCSCQCTAHEESINVVKAN